MRSHTLFVLAVALSLAAAPVVAETDDDREPGPEPSCEPLDDTGDLFRCIPPEECRDKLYQTEECTPPDFCEDNGDGTFTCRFEAGHHDDDRAHEPHCEPADETGEVYHCTPPAACEGKLYQTEECTPPEECTDNGDGTFTCRATRPDHDGSDGHDDYDPHEADEYCSPHPERDDAMICKPPEECRDRLYDVPECTPPEFCEDNGDGTFTCTMPTQPPPAHDGEVHHPPPPGTTDRMRPGGLFDLGEQPLFEGPDPFLVEQARELLREAMHEARDSMRDKLDELRGRYHAATEEMRATYLADREDLRDAFHMCIDTAPANATRAEARAHRLGCIQDARDGLQELRADAQAAHAALRHDLVADAEAHRAHVCTALALALDDVRSLFDHDRAPPALHAEHALGFCAGPVGAQR